MEVVNYGENYQKFQVGMRVSVRTRYGGQSFDNVVVGPTYPDMFSTENMVHMFLDSDMVTVHTSNVWPAPTTAGLVIHEGVVCCADETVGETRRPLAREEWRYYIDHIKGSDREGAYRSLVIES